ncbi:PepSY domain-containing protein [Roseococcus sp.]|uniref:PepSY domain-containing protein n=1 Tax=Roseococcus sp. TaxID=2109646 RepID=UPI003BA91726
MKRRDLLEKSLLLSALGLVLTGETMGSARADDDDDDDRESNRRRAARLARESGQIMGLAELMGQVERRYIGRIVKVELDREDGRWVYEFRILPPDGRMFEVELFAENGQLRRTKGRVQERAN